jgi:hypothetical protein
MVVVAQRRWLILVAAMAKMDATSGVHHYSSTWMLLKTQWVPAMMSLQWMTLKLQLPKKNLALFDAISV